MRYLLCLILLYLMPVVVYADFPQGVVVDGIILDDFDEDQLMILVDNHLSDMRNRCKFSVIIDDTEYILGCEELGWDTDLLEKIDQATVAAPGTYLVSNRWVSQQKIAHTLKNLCESLNQEPVNASISYIPGADEINIVPESIGKYLDYNQITSEVLDALRNGQSFVSVNSVTEFPRIVAEDLSHCLSLFSTNTTNVINRNHNIELSRNSIDGTQVLPGEEFDFFGVVGDTFSDSSEYLIAGTLTNGKPTSGRGGGICQTSATLYGAVKNANLQVVERHIHSARVPYVSIDGEAMVSQGTANFRFINDTGSKITIMSTYENNVLTFYIFTQE